MAITNGFVYNLFTNKGKEHTISFLVDAHEISDNDKPAKRAYRRKFDLMIKERMNIKKNGTRVPEEVLQSFLDTPFSFPSVLKRNVEHHDVVVKEATDNTLRDVNKSLCKELNLLQKENDKINKVKEKIEVFADKVHKLDEVETQNKTLQLENKTLRSTVFRQASKLRNTKGREEYYRKKLKEKEKKSDEY